VGDVVRLDLHTLGRDRQTIGIGRPAQRERHAGQVLQTGTRRAELAALAGRMNAALDALDGGEIGLGQAFSWN